MIVAIIMAIWFGYRANKAGKSIVSWALAGAVLTLVVDTILSKLAVLLVSGSFTGKVDIDAYFAIRIVSAFLALGIMLIIGNSSLPIRIIGYDRLPKRESYTAALDGIPDVIPDNCGECKHFKKTGIIDKFKGQCELYNITTSSNWKCEATFRKHNNEENS